MAKGKKSKTSRVLKPADIEARKGEAANRLATATPCHRDTELCLIGGEFQQPAREAQGLRPRSCGPVSPRAGW